MSACSRAAGAPLRRRRLLQAGGAFVLGGCSRKRAGKPGRIVFKHQPLWGDPGPFRELLARFISAHPGCELVTEALPSSSDLAHQYFLTALEGGAGDFDVFVMDVVWVAELARAGWLVDLSDTHPPASLGEELLSGAATSVVADGRTWAIPWYVDVGLLYRRSDWFPVAPESYDELLEQAARARTDRGANAGYVWQGRQYEGLVCNAYEAIWGHGGETFVDGRLGLRTPKAVAAVQFLRDLIVDGASPRSVTSMAEEESRRVFQGGRAGFMRNWPYAWRAAQADDSAIRGRVGVSPLPSSDGTPGPGVLGGYQLALNVHAPAENRELALALIEHLTSVEAQISLAVSYGRNPSRRAAYQDPSLQRAWPELSAILPMLERARPRPVTAYYPMLTDMLQIELSAAVTGLRSPAEALARAQAFSDRLMGVAE